MDNLDLFYFFRDSTTFKINLSVFFVFIAVLLLLKIFSGFDPIQGTFVAVSIALALYISSFQLKIVENMNNDSNKQIMNKLKALQKTTSDYITSKNFKIPERDNLKLRDSNKLEYLYTDSTLIIFLHSIIKLNDYNPSLFYLILKDINNMLKIQYEIETYYNANNVNVTKQEVKQVSFQDPVPEYTEPKFLQGLPEMIEIVIQCKARVLNNLHSVIHSVPKLPKMYSYLDNSLERMSVLLSMILSNIDNYNNLQIQTEGINRKTRFTNLLIKGTKGYTPADRANWYV